ncbi:DNA-directed RNA polymerase subunit alpha [Rubrobacter radiotolerans]|uniref:DNA-directed RNA polymerase subunit alpha n=1 Tax=Rubrobacter radiotolerans TaxID=42256 RepID=A0AB35T9S4_RUBRA|nr:DNA-directed RNA polymerase subunit alpha [Rubrobacter radiotolerans]MDX5894601.1 DNA-directed RNA polymerase subunit alpha [Rubrobacter radiotolerans]SMC06352.1 DNA-directed RNA polymerase subunit alpha [Rubrobacter radiotolerans DSM 5868]
MLDIAPPRFRVEEEDERRGVFVAEPLPRGLGHTLGNSLRRVMLSGLTGAAATKIRIEGVQHEFSTVEGVREDVVDMILNIKNLKFKLERDEPIELEIVKSGPGDVTAADIELKADVEVVDPETYIATLSSGANLDMRITVERGQGYVRAEQNKSDADPIGVIAIDSLFSPVQRVNYTVSEIRAGARADLDSLTIEVFTDGRLEPREALNEASRQLIDILGLFAEGYQGSGGAASETSMGGRRNVIDDVRPIEDLELTVRSYNCLKREGVDTIGQLATMTEEELMNIRNLGMKSVDEIRSKLLELGYPIESDQ